MIQLTPEILRKLDSATKYPPIPTYHHIQGRGILTDPHIAFTGTITAQEKVDGTNCRILMLPDAMTSAGAPAWLIGSRDILLAARGDLIPNPALGIVDALAPIADTLPALPYSILTFYFELYGDKQTNAWRNYGDGTPTVRVYDATLTDPAILNRDLPRIAAWRDNGGQQFLTTAELANLASNSRLTPVPHLFQIPAADLPTTIDGMRAFMAPYATTRAATHTGAPGASEGIILRTHDRHVIAKARYCDYDRTLKHLTTAAQGR